MDRPFEAVMRAGLWRFAGVELHDADSRLRIDGRDQVLDRSSHEILRYLLDRAGEVVTKDELLEAGWPGRLVSENSLAKSVSRLRQALGADAAALRAVHGYGYRLGAVVAWQPVPDVRTSAQPHEAMHLHEGDRVPHRPGLRLEKRLGEGSAGVSFLARDERGGARVVKFATSEGGLRGIKREIAITRYIRAVKPDLSDVAPVSDWNLAQPPFFLERDYFPDGHLAEWAAARGGLAALPLAERIALLATL